MVCVEILTRQGKVDGMRSKHEGLISFVIVEVVIIALLFSTKPSYIPANQIRR